MTAEDEFLRASPFSGCDRRRQRWTAAAYNGPRGARASTSYNKIRANVGILAQDIERMQIDAQAATRIWARPRIRRAHKNAASTRLNQHQDRRPRPPKGAALSQIGGNNFGSGTITNTRARYHADVDKRQPGGALFARKKL